MPIVVILCKTVSALGGSQKFECVWAAPLGTADPVKIAPPVYVLPRRIW